MNKTATGIPRTCLNAKIKFAYIGTAALAVAVLAVAGMGGADDQPPAHRAPVDGYRVIHVYPHDRLAFTQGLVYADGHLYESTGLKGQSSLREVDLETGRVLRRRDLPQRYFAEGLAVRGAELIQLTYRAGTAFVYDRASFAARGAFTYKGEGWGLTGDGTRLIMSDGTATLRFLDSRTFRETGRITVHDGDTPVDNLNELEYVRGEVYANIWQSDRVARIDPASGRVTGWIDLKGLLGAGDHVPRSAILNGIAYDARHERLFVTGKLWPKLFEIRVTPGRQ